MRPLLPAHIAWPLFIIAILMMSFCAVAVTIVAAYSDGGAQVLSDYHGQATSWDAQAMQQAASDRLGWQVQVLVHGQDSTGLRIIRLTLTDRAGAPVSNATGYVRLERPQFARPIAEVEFVPLAVEPGVYLIHAPIDAPGLWDFHIRAVQGNDIFMTQLRQEIL